MVDPALLRAAVVIGEAIVPVDVGTVEDVDVVVMAGEPVIVAGTRVAAVRKVANGVKAIG